MSHVLDLDIIVVITSNIGCHCTNVIRIWTTSPGPCATTQAFQLSDSACMSSQSVDMKVASVTATNKNSSHFTVSYRERTFLHRTWQNTVTISSKNLTVTQWSLEAWISIYEVVVLIYELRNSKSKTVRCHLSHHIRHIPG